jgi:nucleoside-diphosphate-sugar epimerase
MVVVTGGTGLLGAHLLFDLVQKHDDIRAIKRENSDLEQVKKTFAYYSPNYEEDFEKIVWLNADVTDYFSLEQAFEGADEVYHLAALVSFNPSDQVKMMTINVKGTANVVNAALHCGVKKLCYVSSIAALGTAEEGKEIDEESPWKDSDKTSAYSISKYKAELEVWRGMEEGLQAVIVNPSVIIGPTKWESGSAALFSLIWKGLHFYTGGINGFVYVRDVSSAMIRLMESEINAQRFVLNAENISYKDLFKSIAKYLNKKEAHIAVTRMMSELSWRLFKVQAFFSGKQPTITKDTARSSMKKSRYSAQKIKKVIHIQFHDVDEMIALTAKEFLKDHL